MHGCHMLWLAPHVGVMLYLLAIPGLWLRLLNGGGLSLGLTAILCGLGVRSLWVRICLVVWAVLTGKLRLRIAGPSWVRLAGRLSLITSTRGVTRCKS